jgi:hypothetical protein
VRTAVLALSILVSTSIHAQCELGLRFSPSPAATLTWNRVPGAKLYEVQESVDGLVTSRNYFLDTTSLPIQRRATADLRVDYLVTAQVDSSAAGISETVPGCSERIEVRLSVDQELRRVTRKSIVPVVGSAEGAFGSRFKTSLKLTSTTGAQRGRIVFHPAGAVASGSDPWIPYAFNGVGTTMYFDDIVAQLGRSGIGTLDIIPDEGASDVVPEAEARLFNDTPSGTFGSYAEAVLPRDYLDAPVMRVEIPDGPFRVNVGVRALTDVSAAILIYGADKRLRELREMTFPADYMTMAPVAQFLGREMTAGEFFTMTFKGSAIPFYTVTENRTNDPAVFVPRNRRPGDVGNYVY